jgi:hypothetical protein
MILGSTKRHSAIFYPFPLPLAALFEPIRLAKETDVDHVAAPQPFPNSSAALDWNSNPMMGSSPTTHAS